MEELQIKKMTRMCKKIRVTLDNFLVQQKKGYANSTNRDNTVSPYVSTVGQSFTNADDLPTDPLMPDLEDTADLLNTGIFSGAYLHQKAEENKSEDYQNCLVACFLSQIEPKMVTQALQDPRWIEAMQDELLQNGFKVEYGTTKHDGPRKFYRELEEIHQVDESNNTGYDNSKGRMLSTVIKWDIFAREFAGKKKAPRMVLALIVVTWQRKRFRQTWLSWHIEDASEKAMCAIDGAGVDCSDMAEKEIQANMALMAFSDSEVNTDKLRHQELVRLVPSRFVIFDLVAQGHTQEEGIDYDEIEEEVYVCQPPGFEDPDHPDKVYKVQQKKKGIFISQDKYVHEILRKYNYTDVKSASTPTDLEKPLVQDGDAADVDEHLYRSMIGSLMYLTASRPDIIFAVFACTRFQYSKDSSLELVAYTDNDYAGATQDRKSTTEGCQFLGNRLISWQCKKQTVVATSTTEAEYVAAVNCCGQIDTEHNVADLLTKGFDAGRFQYLVSRSAGFHQVIDFLNRSHICYALTKKPDVYISFIKQFWRSAEATTDDNGEVQITATIDDKLTFQKGAFSPQWRFLIHNILHCLSPKKTAWEQFSSNIATAVICLATNRKYNFSRMIFEHMVSNISSPHKFFMYPRFIQICLDMQRKQLQQHSRTYHVPSLSIKVFNNMKRPTKGYSGQEVDLFPTMLDVSKPSTSPSRITSSPSHSHEPSPSPEPSIEHSIEHSHAPLFEHSPDHTTAAPTQPSPGAKQHFTTPNESPLHAVHSHGSNEGSLKLKELTNLVTKLSERIRVLEDDLRKTKKTYSSAFTKLILRVKKLKARVKIGKGRKRAKVVLSEDDEDVEDDSSKQGRKLTDAEKGSDEVSTAGATKGAASEVLVVSTAEENISTAGRTVTYKRRSEEKRTRKDKGKAIMTESEPKKKSKKELE
ncbi:hypothetical protein Tco_0749352 [Tanacetum coccineum]|uniref:Reverse transcriptase Ty1/copia-type domain-containing protein n=1 Tax=Tanacetum coccineum TaxID=301880 RepID=A0ABQ4YZG9_9ASTR